MRPKGALKENFSVKRHPLKWRNWNKLSLIKNFNYRHQINNLQSSKAKCLSQAQMTQPNCVKFVCNSNLQSVSIWLTTLSKPIFKLSLTAVLKFKKSRANISFLWVKKLTTTSVHFYCESFVIMSVFLMTDKPPQDHLWPRKQWNNEYHVKTLPQQLILNKWYITKPIRFAPFNK